MKVFLAAILLTAAAVVAAPAASADCVTPPAGAGAFAGYHHVNAHASCHTYGYTYSWGDYTYASGAEYQSVEFGYGTDAGRSHTRVEVYNSTFRDAGPNSSGATDSRGIQIGSYDSSGRYSTTNARLYSSEYESDYGGYASRSVARGVDVHRYDTGGNHTSAGAGLDEYSYAYPGGSFSRCTVWARAEDSPVGSPEPAEVDSAVCALL